MASRKRYRTPKIEDGELRMQWGKMPYDYPDMCFYWGKDCSKRDMNLLHYVMSSFNFELNTDKERRTFLQELESRGYDLTTLKFSIKKKADSE